MSGGLYPKLDEPWSDVDDEGGVREGGGGRDDSRWSFSNPTTLGTPAGGEGEEETDTISLQEFEDHYLRNRKKSNEGFSSSSSRRLRSERSKPEQNSLSIFGPEDEKLERREKEGRGGGGGGKSWRFILDLARKVWGLGVRGARWLAKASIWKKAVVAALLGLLCSMIFGTLRDQWSTTRYDNFLPCPSQRQIQPCIPESDVRRAKTIASKLVDVLHARAGHYICGGGEDVPTLALSLYQLRNMPVLKEEKTESFKHVFYLVLANPHWNIRWVDKDNNTVTELTHYPHSSDLLSSTSPPLSLKCRLLLILADLFRLAQWILLIMLGGVVLYALFSLYRKRTRSHEAAVFSLVGRIMDVMKYHYKKSQTKKDLLPYLAIIHVRDMLIPPSERKLKERLWNEAVEWIASHESRVRVETRRIAGQDFDVWRWIQEDPPPTEIPSSRQPTGGQRSSQQGNWHGSVFDHYPPEITTRVAPPTGTPSVCIRLKNMFEPTRKMSETQIHELENAVLERCQPHGPVVHVWVDKRSPVGCVYLKMGSLKSAMDSYNALHGGWYKGKLVTAKYIPEPKYHKWFPAAANAKTPILLS